MSITENDVLLRKPSDTNFNDPIDILCKIFNENDHCSIHVGCVWTEKTMMRTTSHMLVNRECEKFKLDQLTGMPDFYTGTYCQKGHKS